MLQEYKWTHKVNKIPDSFVSESFLLSTAHEKSGGLL